MQYLRPQSAKPGYRQAHMQGNSFSDFKEESELHPHHKHGNRKQVKLLKPDLTTNDFTRIMPKKIYHDKERLYSEALQLKEQINKVTEENVRLKTRITILEKEKSKLNRYL